MTIADIGKHLKSWKDKGNDQDKYSTYSNYSNSAYVTSGISTLGNIGITADEAVSNITTISNIDGPVAYLTNTDTSTSTSSGSTLTWTSAPSWGTATTTTSPYTTSSSGWVTIDSYSHPEYELGEAETKEALVNILIDDGYLDDINAGKVTFIKISEDKWIAIKDALAVEKA